MDKNAGFTLIELLVVVLIIGILSAVALPQYQLAVQKARTMRLIPLLRSISDAENVYYMANGSYTSQFDDLDINMPGGGNISISDNVNRINYGDFECYIQSSDIGPASAYCNDKRAEAPALEKYFSRDSFICWGQDGEGSLSWRVCQNVSGKTLPDASSAGSKRGFQF